MKKNNNKKKKSARDYSSIHREREYRERERKNHRHSAARCEDKKSAKKKSFEKQVKTRRWRGKQTFFFQRENKGKLLVFAHLPDSHKSDFLTLHINYV